MRDIGLRSTRNAKSGVDAGPLAAEIKVTREMARRYTEGTAIPDLNKMERIAAWLGVRLPWLRDGEGPKRVDAPHAAQTAGAYEPINAEAREIALAWSRLSPGHRDMMRDILYMLVLSERRFPWLLRGRPKSETYDQWERRQEQNFLAMSVLEADRKATTK